MAWHVLRAAWLRWRNPKASLRALDAALRRNPGLSVTHKFRADVLVDMGRYEEALGSYARALEMVPHPAPCHVAMGTTLVKLGRLQEAVAHFEEAVRLDPDDDEAFEYLVSTGWPSRRDPPSPGKAS